MINPETIRQSISSRVDTIAHSTPIVDQSTKLVTSASSRSPGTAVTVNNPNSSMAFFTLAGHWNSSDVGAIKSSTTLANSFTQLQATLTELWDPWTSVSVRNP